MANDTDFADRMNLRLDAAAFRVALAPRFRSVAALARAASVPETTCRAVSHGMVPPAETRAKIALALGVDETQLWKPVGAAA